jgi:hypothetical protein
MQFLLLAASSLRRSAPTLPDSFAGSRRRAGLARRAAILSLCIAVVAAGCGRGESGAATRGRATITAVPNPVPAGSDPGVTTVRWDTADDSSGEVYVAVDGGEERLFAAGAKEAKEADWISAGSVFEFRLYQASDRAKLLASVRVTHAKP